MRSLLRAYKKEEKVFVGKITLGALVKLEGYSELVSLQYKLFAAVARLG